LAQIQQLIDSKVDEKFAKFQADYDEMMKKVKNQIVGAIKPANLFGKPAATAEGKLRPVEESKIIINKHIIKLANIINVPYKFIEIKNEFIINDEIYNLNINPKFYIFNVTNNNFSDYSKMRYGLASSLMFDDIYFSFDASVGKHGQTWIYDEYNLDFSKPKNSAYEVRNNVWRRDFAYFSVLLNSGEEEVEINFPENYKKAYSWWNDNQTIIKLDKQSAIILEPQLNIYNKYFRNKAEYSAFNFLGKKVYTSYNLINDDFSDGQLISQNENGFDKNSGELIQCYKSN
jgi:hypothetical protein